MAGEENLIDIQEFDRLDLRVGEIKEAAAVKGTDKLVVMKVDLGSEVRQIVAGIRGSYAPEALTGRKAVVLVNLKPAKLRGVDSDGMILAAEGPDGVSLIEPAPGLPNGARIR